ncbi:MAG TPA: zinc dependent phospholipase C family protein, partial [Desulfosporosinus sp.]|nr:zinc dependent phospholipase C family protein [Desulfosporosinus sp.]
AIRNAVEKELDIKLDTFSFMYGNIKPDLETSSVKIPHFKHTTMELVQAEIENLTTLRLNKSKRCSKQLSERIGVITHYLSDFFCYAHNEYFESKHRSHLLYEFQLLYHFQKNKKVVKGHSYIKPTDIQSSSNDIITYIEEAHDSYIKTIKENPLPFELDTANALTVCILVCVSILSICLDHELKIAI